MAELEVHPDAELLPSMTDDEFAALVADITANGLLDPITPRGRNYVAAPG